MEIHEILKNIPQLTDFKEEGEIIFANASRDDLAFIANMLVNENNIPLSSLFVCDDRKENESFCLRAIFSLDKTHQWLNISAIIPASDPTYPSITTFVMSAHWYERYLYDMFGVIPFGHPDLRRLVNHENIPDGIHPLKKDFKLNSEIPYANEPYPMHHIEGEGVYEIPVGPIHAGIIEPGHFRFNVAGERIMTLEGKLFFTHKGVEKLLEGKTPTEGMPFIERLSGDMAASHTLAYIEALEKISNCNVPERALMLRSLICELERITMHIHDLANMGGMGTGYSFIAANGFRIKERMMRLSDEIFGNRFWRGFIVPGGVFKDLKKEQLEKIFNETEKAYLEIRKIAKIALASEGFLDRLQTTGVLPLEAAVAFGAVGLPARASGVSRDVRKNHPYAAYKKNSIKIAVKHSSDVFARYRMRILEMEYSMDFIKNLIEKMPEGEISINFEVKDGFSIGAVESWRGEIICALQIKNGVIERCFPRDPSFCNWALFGIMGPGNIVPDFPLINKSLNLSYSGTDL